MPKSKLGNTKHPTMGEWLICCGRITGLKTTAMLIIMGPDTMQPHALTVNEKGTKCIEKDAQGRKDWNKCTNFKWLI